MQTGLRSEAAARQDTQIEQEKMLMKIGITS
jgi:hypothetical protein